MIFPGVGTVGFRYAVLVRFRLVLVYFQLILVYFPSDFGLLSTDFGPFSVWLWHIVDWFWSIFSLTLVYYRLILVHFPSDFGILSTDFGLFSVWLWHIVDWFWFIFVWLWHIVDRFWSAFGTRPPSTTTVSLCGTPQRRARPASRCTGVSTSNPRIFTGMGLRSVIFNAKSIILNSNSWQNAREYVQSAARSKYPHPHRLIYFWSDKGIYQRRLVYFWYDKGIYQRRLVYFWYDKGMSTSVSERAHVPVSDQK